MIPRGALVLVALGLAAAACSPPEPKRLLDLPAPTYAFHVETASCGSLKVIDAVRHYFTEEGCEGKTTGFVRHGKTTEAHARAVISAFDHLPHEAPCDGGTPYVYIFTSHVGEVQKTWRVCLADKDAKLPPAFAAVEAAFAALP